MQCATPAVDPVVDYVLDDFDYDLPDALVARQPEAQRSASRLLRVHNGTMADYRFCDLPTLLQPGDLLILNDTRVLAARLTGVRQTGGKFELLVERIRSTYEALVHMKSSKPARPGTRLVLKDSQGADVAFLCVEGREGDLFVVRAAVPWLSLLEQWGEVPLPPYLRRPAIAADRLRYQTVYAAHDGSVAAPTAGLHFDQTLLHSLSERGIEQAFITLHVGAGTFQPVRVQHLAQHVMHAESVCVPEATVAKILATQKAGGRIVAVGSTCVRALETAALSGTLQPFRGDSQLFIRPGFKFRVVNQMITNFHLPRSTLLMMVAAFAGYSVLRQAYQYAIARQYRFFSYGDACLFDAEVTG